MIRYKGTYYATVKDLLYKQGISRKEYNFFRAKYSALRHEELINLIKEKRK